MVPNESAAAALDTTSASFSVRYHDVFGSKVFKVSDIPRVPFPQVDEFEKYTNLSIEYSSLSSLAGARSAPTGSSRHRSRLGSSPLARLGGSSSNYKGLSSWIDKDNSDVNHVQVQ